MSEAPPEPQAEPQRRKLSPKQDQELHTAARSQLATYTSHKVVRAAKIKEIRFGYDQTLDRNAWLLIPEDPRLAPIEVPNSFVAKHDPQAPGYFVVYPDSDGYESWSPVGPFESGYTLSEEAQPQDTQALLAQGLAYREPIDNQDRHPAAERLRELANVPDEDEGPQT